MRIEGTMAWWMGLALSLTALGCRQADGESRPAHEPAVEGRGAGAETADENRSAAEQAAEPVEGDTAAVADTAPTELEPADATPAEGEVATLVPVDPSWPTPPEGMVYIPAADVMLGRANDDYRPLGVRRVEAFFIDRFEVTTVAYEACVASRRCRRYTRPTEVWYGVSETWDPFERWLASACNYGRPEQADHPMNCVAWRDADTFCRARAGTLPTFDQREYAGRWTDHRRYPWGNERPRDGVYANYDDLSLGRLLASLNIDIGTHGSIDDGFPATAPVGSFPRDQSPFGVMDLAGNVSEWTATLGRMDSHPVDPLHGELVPLVASSDWIVVGSPLVAAQARTPTGLHPAVGFRCAAPVGP